MGNVSDIQESVMSNYRTVWSDKDGDVRKKKDDTNTPITVDESHLKLQVRRLTSGKGRTVIEIKGLPLNDEWCERLAKELKKSLGVGGTYKNNYIELHGEKIEKVTAYLDSRKISWKKTGG